MAGTGEKNQRDLFKGLSEKNLNMLYRVADIKKLQPGEFLTTDNDSDQSVYLVLDGEINIVKKSHSQDQRIATLQKGDLAGEASFIRQTDRTISVLASKPSSIMAIERSVLDSLDEGTQLFFYKKFTDFAARRLTEVISIDDDRDRQNKRLMEALYSLGIRNCPDYKNADVILNIIKKVPKLPNFIHKMAEIMTDSNLSLKEITDYIRDEPSVVANVLKTLNSPFYGFRQKISDIHHAIVLLGYNELYQLVINEGVRKTMPDTPEFRALHEHSVAISRIAFIISQQSQVGIPSQISTIGLLHDLGQCVIHLLKEKNPKLTILIDTIDQALVGSLLLKDWNLPDIIWKSIEFQYYPEFALPEMIPDEVKHHVAIFYLAHLCLDYITGREEHALQTLFLDDYKELLNWESLSIPGITRQHVIPNLVKNIQVLPTFFKTLLNDHL